jgi:hypothetical protein
MSKKKEIKRQCKDEEPATAFYNSTKANQKLTRAWEQKKKAHAHKGCLRLQEPCPLQLGRATPADVTTALQDTHN